MGGSKKSRKPANDGFSMPDQAKTEKSKSSDRASKTKTRISVICVVLVLALCFGVIIYTKVADSGYFYRITESVTSENFTVNNAMMSYFFNLQYQQMASTLQQMGVDTTKNLKDQTYASNMTWFDYLMKNVTVPQVQRILVLCEAAKAAGFELSDHDKEHVDEAVESVKTMAKSYAAQYGGSESYYIRNIYGYGITIDDIRDAIELNQLAAAYSEKLTDSYEYTEDEWAAYLEEHKSDFQVIDYVYYTFEAEEEDTEDETETAGTTDTAADSSDTAATDATDVETSAPESTAADTSGADDDEEEELSPEKQVAYDLANILAQQMMAESDNALEIFNTGVRAHLENVVYAEEEDADKKAESVQSDMDATVETAVKNSESNEFLKFAFSDDRTEDVFVTDDNENGKYTVYYITKAPYIEEYVTKNVRMIALSAASEEDIEGVLQTVLDEFEASDKTEDDFAALAEKYSHDSSAHENGGLYENQGKTDLGVDELDNWLYDDARKAGDYTSASNGEDGTSEVLYVAYYVGDGLVKWKRDVDSAMVSEAYEEDYKKLAETHEVDVDYKELYKIPGQAGI